MVAKGNHSDPLAAAASVGEGEEISKDEQGYVMKVDEEDSTPENLSNEAVENTSIQKLLER